MGRVFVESLVNFWEDLNLDNLETGAFGFGVGVFL